MWFSTNNFDSPLLIARSALAIAQIRCEHYFARGSSMMDEFVLEIIAKWEMAGGMKGRRVIGKGRGGRQVRGCSIFIGERRRNDFKCLQKLPRHQRFLIIYIISIALIAAALIICRFMFSSGWPWRRWWRSVTSPVSDTQSDRMWRLLLNYLLRSKYRQDASFVYWNVTRGTVLNVK